MGPGLGADSIAAGKVASVIGLVLVVVFMVTIYGLFGFFADVALFVNMVMILAALSALQATLTLPGIAGIVLTIGMAVDANVLVLNGSARKYGAEERQFLPSMQDTPVPSQRLLTQISRP